MINQIKKTLSAWAKQGSRLNLISIISSSRGSPLSKTLNIKAQLISCFIYICIQ